MTIDSLFGIQLEKGAIKNSRSLFKFGSNPDVGTSEETIWDQGGLYSYLASASVIKVSSSNSNDTSSGTGARTVILYGLDADYNEISETITLNGQTEVNTTLSYLRVYRCQVTSAGSSGTAAGDIYFGTGNVTSGVPANIYAKIIIGENQTLMGIYTVPSGHTGYIFSGTMCSGTETANKYITSKLKVRPFGQVFQTRALVTINSGFVPFDFGVAPTILEKSDIEARGFTSSGTAQISATFSIVLVKND